MSFNSALTTVNDEEAHFLQLYKLVQEREKYLNNEAVIVQYGSVLRYFMKFLQQKDTYSSEIVRILYRINLKLGDIYFDEAMQIQKQEKYFLAAEYYNQALLYAQNLEEKNRVLLALKDVFYYVNDEEAYVKVEESWAENHTKEGRFAAYLLLAQNANSLQSKATFLEKALNEIVVQDENFYAKYQNTLDICSQLMAIYELLGEKEKIQRIKKLRNNTLKLLN